MNKLTQIKNRSLLIYRVLLVLIVSFICLITYLTYKNAIDIVIYIPSLMSVFGIFITTSIFLFTKKSSNSTIKLVLRGSSLITLLLWIMMSYQVFIKPENVWQILLACFILELMLALSTWSMYKIPPIKIIQVLLYFSSIICFLTLLFGHTYPILFPIGIVHLSAFSLLLLFASLVKSRKN